MFTRIQNKSFGLILVAAMALSSLAMTGCQVSMGGQTLPSPYFLRDDIQYFPKGPEFKLQNEAAELKKARARASINP